MMDVPMLQPLLESAQARLQTGRTTHASSLEVGRAGLAMWDVMRYVTRVSRCIHHGIRAVLRGLKMDEDGLTEVTLRLSSIQKQAKP